jgi:hypothetical protein
MCNKTNVRIRYARIVYTLPTSLLGKEQRAKTLTLPQTSNFSIEMYAEKKPFMSN